MTERASILIYLGLCILVSAARAQTDVKVAATWQVQKYDIAVTLPQAETDRNVVVRAKLDLKNVSSAAATTLTLRISPSAEVAAVRVNEAQLEFTKGEEKAGSGALQKIGLRVSPVPAGGPLSVTLDYKLNVKDNSGLASLSPGHAQFLPLSFWYPTPNSWFFARGADYAPHRIAVTSPGLSTVSGGTALPGGIFDQKLRSQPFFAAGNWDVLNVSGVSVYVTKGAGADERKVAGEIASLTKDARSFLSGVLGVAPDATLNIVATRRGAGFSSGGTIFIDSGVLRRSRIDEQTAITIVEGLAKTWLGGSVAVTGDGDGAVREGLSKYLATQFIETKYGKDVADVERTRQRSAYAAVVARDAPVTQVSALDDYYYSVVANKGAMIWRLLARKVGETAFASGVKASLSDGTVSLSEIRSNFPGQKDFLDFGFDQVTEMNLQAGLPQQNGGEWKAALRNTGAVDATVVVTATLGTGERMNTQSTIRAQSFGDVSFRTGAKVVRLEIDSEKLFPQTDYSDDIAPREFTENDPLLAVKRLFDKQEFAKAERLAASVLLDLPRFDDVRVLLGRSLLAQGKTAEAEREFKALLDEKLPSPRSLAWANVGLADIASRSGDAAAANRFVNNAIASDAEYGAGLAARTIRNKLNNPVKADDQISAFFAQFDRSAAGNKKAELQALIVPGEVSKFAGGIAGQTEQWKTQIVAIDNLDPETALVEANLTIKLLNRDIESGTAVYRLTRTPSGWKLSGVDIFEVR